VKFPARQAIVLPLIGLLTLVVIGLPTEIVARLLFSETPIGARSCLILNDPSTGVRGVPNSQCTERTYESEWVQYKFNSCGYRAAMECGQKRPGTFRIVMVGSSIAHGYTVPSDKSFAAILPLLLSNETGRDIELYNQAMPWGTPRSVYLRFNEALAEQPDLLLWAVTPWDIFYVDLTVPETHAAALPKQAVGSSTWDRLKATVFRTPDLSRFSWVSSRAFFMLQHILYQSDSIYLSHSLSASDEYASSLQDKPGKEWQDKLRRFDNYVAEMIARAKAAHVPFVFTALPRHAQVVMISGGVAPPGINPYSFGDQIKAVVDKNGGTYIDSLQQFRNLPNVNVMFYPVDQHVTVAGHQLLAQVIARGLTQGANPVIASAQPAALPPPPPPPRAPPSR
jgi:hypothetical protein